MLAKELYWDTALKIRTLGRDGTHADEYRYPYEPTPYAVLERLRDSGLIGAEDVILDYGCGKGRVDFFLSHETEARTIGVEYDESIYNYAVENQKTTPFGEKSRFFLGRAEAYEVPHEVTGCYFFNPFSAELLHTVMARILESYYEAPREIFLYFYFPSDEYVSYLMTVDELDFYDEIPCDDLFPENSKRERILIFTLPSF